jgi:cytochrome c oxidase subunit IV
MSDTAHAEHHVASLRLYVGIFLVLMVGTVLTVAAAYVDMGLLNTPVALTIAVVKATLVLLYFMHLRWSERLTALFIGASFVWLGILMAFTFSDIVTRNLLPYPLR